MIAFGEEIGSRISGGTVLELIGDVGAGKTTFTISRIYEGEKMTLSHYDFYRLGDYGIMEMELAESLENPNNVTVVEWAGDLANILPKKHLRLTFDSVSEDCRKIKVEETE